MLLLLLARQHALSSAAAFSRRALVQLSAPAPSSPLSLIITSSSSHVQACPPVSPNALRTLASGAASLSSSADRSPLLAAQRLASSGHLGGAGIGSQPEQQPSSTGAIGSSGSSRGRSSQGVCPSQQQLSLGAAQPGSSSSTWLPAALQPCQQAFAPSQQQQQLPTGVSTGAPLASCDLQQHFSQHLQRRWHQHYQHNQQQQHYYFQQQFRRSMATDGRLDSAENETVSQFTSSSSGSTSSSTKPSRRSHAWAPLRPPQLLQYHQQQLAQQRQQQQLQQGEQQAEQLAQPSASLLPPQQPPPQQVQQPPPQQVQVVHVVSSSSSDMAAPHTQQQHPAAAVAAVAKTFSYPVHAVHVGAEIDAQRFAEEHKNAFDEVVQQIGHKDHIIFKLADCDEDQDLLSAKSSSELEAGLQYMVVYRYGSVIFVNVPRDVVEDHLSLLAPFFKAPQGQQVPVLDMQSMRSDETTIVVDAALSAWSKLGPDKVIVQKLDVANLRVISNVLSQSVALDYFNSRVDEAIKRFTPYLVSVATSGQCDSVKEAGLLQLIAENSLMYTDVVTKIGLLDISQTAWKQDRHYELWESLRADYEIEMRFEAIDRKLGPMIENAKFLLDVRAEQKSSGAEWIIIALIMLEVVINLAGHAATWHA